LRGVDFELLRRSGCRELQIGIESADTNILRNMNKASDPELYSEVIRELLDAGINCSCYFIFGFPGETDETVSHTIEFIRNLESRNLGGALSWSIYPFILAPLSPIYGAEMRQQYGLSGYGQAWEHKSMNSKQARMQILKAFLAIENSGPIYRGDDQDLLQALTPRQRKDFTVSRHRLAKLSLQNALGKDQIIKIFSEVFSKLN
jgi:anaerobic magnesium-protoporphyrin IX monomethyl ester cyclase